MENKDGIPQTVAAVNALLTGARLTLAEAISVSGQVYLETLASAAAAVSKRGDLWPEFLHICSSNLSAVQKRCLAEARQLAAIADPVSNEVH